MAKKRRTTTTVHHIHMSPTSRHIMGDYVKGDYVQGDKIEGDKVEVINCNGSVTYIEEEAENPTETKVKAWFGPRPITAEHYWWDVEGATWNLHDRIEPGCIYVLTEGLSGEPEYPPKHILGCHTEKQARRA